MTDTKLITYGMGDEQTLLAYGLGNDLVLSSFETAQVVVQIVGGRSGSKLTKSQRQKADEIIRIFCSVKGYDSVEQQAFKKQVNIYIDNITIESKKINNKITVEL